MSLARGADGEPPPKKIAGAGGNATPVAKIINNLAAELIEIIIQLVPQAYDSDSLFDEMAAADGPPKIDYANVADVRIWTQFKLRLLSKKWAALVYRQFSAIGLAYEKGRLCFFADEDCKPLILCKPRSFLLDSKKQKLTYATVSGIAKHTLIDRVEALNVRVRNTKQSDESVVAVLDRLARAVTQPCFLDLLIDVLELDAVHSLLPKRETNFQQQFPDLSLRRLRFEFCSDLDPVQFKPQPEHLGAANRCLKFLLSSPALSKDLEDLRINLFVLKAALQTPIQGGARSSKDSRSGEGLTFESMRELWLDCRPCAAGYDYSNATKKAELFAFQSSFSRLFPSLERICFTHARAQINFAALAQMPSLISISVTTEFFQTDWDLQKLPNVRDFTIFADASPFPLSELMSSDVTSLCLEARHASIFAHFAAVLTNGACGAIFQNLSDLTINGSNFETFDRPSYNDLVQLLRALNKLRSLSSLAIEASIDDAPWSHGGDLSLLEFIPEKVKSLTLAFALAPSGCAISFKDDDEDEEECNWSLQLPVDAPHLAQSIYKAWLRSLLQQISVIPSLEQVRCICVAPKFEAIVDLAAKGRRSADFAIADLGLSCVSHVTVTENYQRMRVGEPPRDGDRMDFRFIISPRAQFDPHSLKPLNGLVSQKKKIVNVIFENSGWDLGAS